MLFCAEFLDDVEKVRIATENRLRAMLEVLPDAVIGYESQLEAFVGLEHEATLALQRAVRKHPLGGWIKRTVGIGEKQGARLLAAIGDPAYNHAEDRPRRGPAELWAYCGLHTIPVDQGEIDNPQQQHVDGDSKTASSQISAEVHKTGAAGGKSKRASSHIPNATHSSSAAGTNDAADLPEHDTQRACVGGVKNVAARRRKGHQANWNSQAKMRAFLCAESCIKQRHSPYREVYDKARASWADRDTTDLHKHNHALRLVAKEILKDLFVEARKLQV